MTTILARKKNGKKCQSVTGFKNVEGALSKHLKGGYITHPVSTYPSIRNVVNMENGEIKVENVDTNIKDDSQLTIDNWPNSKRIGMKNGISGIAYAECV